MKALERRTRPTKAAKTTRRLFIGTAIILVALVAYGVVVADGAELPESYSEAELSVSGMH